MVVVVAVAVVAVVVVVVVVVVFVVFVVVEVVKEVVVVIVVVVVVDTGSRRLMCMITAHDDATQQLRLIDVKSPGNSWRHPPVSDTGKNHSSGDAQPANKELSDAKGSWK